MKLRPLLTITLAGATFGCGLPSATVTPRYGVLSVDGTFQADVGSGGAESDLDTLGLGDDVDTIMPRADVEWGGMQLTVAGNSTEFDGNGRTEGSITLDDVTIPGNADVYSDFAFTSIGAFFTWDLFPTELVDVGLGLGVSYIELDAKITEDSSGERIKSKESAPVPVLVGRLGSEIGRFSVSGLVGVMDLDVDDVDARIIDLDVSGRFHMFGGEDHLGGWLVAGYRRYDIDADYDDGDSKVKADFTLDGPYVGIDISF